MEVSGQLLSPTTLSPGKESQLSSGLEFQWGPEPAGTWIMMQRKKSVRSRESQFPGHLACSLVTILTELTLPSFIIMKQIIIKEAGKSLKFITNFNYFGM
jgi:hypothetical protein